MAQVRIYGLRSQLSARRKPLSDAIHESLVESLELPPDKRFQRFIMLDREDFIAPQDRTEDYTIVEISIFEGRSVSAKKKLVEELYTRTFAAVGIAPRDLEITIFETPRSNWGIRGKPGDELQLNYKVEI